MTNDMRHMEYLDAVRARDLRTLRDKEATYQGSWKQRGGVGAFMMMARKWDRLESMLAKDGTSGEIKAPPYDVFERVARDAAWAKQYESSLEMGRMAVDSDGTVLAELRDLRCYLTLVEAELMSRGVVRGAEPAKVREISPYFDGVKARMDGTVLSSVEQAAERRVPRFDGGGQHAVLTPWQVDEAWFELQKIDVGMRQTFWRRLGAQDLFVLEAHVISHTIPRQVSGLYESMTEGWIVRVKLCPEELREFFPSLQREMNAKEHDEAPPWQRDLYVWSNRAEGKYELSGTAQAWARET